MCENCACGSSLDWSSAGIAGGNFVTRTVLLLLRLGIRKHSWMKQLFAQQGAQKLDRRCREGYEFTRRDMRVFLESVRPTTDQGGSVWERITAEVLKT